MKIAIYGGTFDPVHQGHLILARTALETFHWDKLYFVPCAQSPHKKNNPVASDQDRLKMLQLAIKGEMQLKVDDFEIRQGGISYSIDTVNHFQKKFPRAKLFWLLGADQIAKLKMWHRFEELKQKVTFIFLNRDETKKGALRNKLLLTRRIDISATEIRSRLKKSLSIRYLVTEEVAHYIKKEKIYFS
ncbi:MAG: nicotinate (nicotinamide) nucleotide adenylyltransferase [Verrucomicrobiia bacterium]